MTTRGLGDNSGDVLVNVEVRLFNSLTGYAKPNGNGASLAVAAGTTVGELADLLRIPRDRLYLVLVNGRDMTPGRIGADVRTTHVVEDGDVVAFSGAVPYSYGYGAPVV